MAEKIIILLLISKKYSSSVKGETAARSGKISFSLDVSLPFDQGSSSDPLNGS